MSLPRLPSCRYWFHPPSSQWHCGKWRSWAGRGCQSIPEKAAAADAAAEPAPSPPPSALILGITTSVQSADGETSLSPRERRRRRGEVGGRGSGGRLDALRSHRYARGAPLTTSSRVRDESPTPIFKQLSLLRSLTTGPKIAPYPSLNRFLRWSQSRAHKKTLQPLTTSTYRLFPSPQSRGHPVRSLCARVPVMHLTDS